MSLEIKVGHRYRTRSGDVVEIIGDNYSVTHPFLGKVQWRDYITSFMSCGQWLLDEVTDMDIIEELPADAPE